MAQDAPHTFAPSWFSGFEGQGQDTREQRRKAFARLWRTFVQARVFIASILLALQVFEWVSNTGGPRWLTAVCALHLLTAVALLLWRPAAVNNQTGSYLWPWTIGLDLVTIAVLQVFQLGSINYTLLFALPVLFSAILGSLTLSLATAAAVTLFLLGDAFLAAPALGDGATARFLQAGLTGTGFFFVALLTNQLAARLAREAILAQSSQAVARTQAQVNELVIESLSQGVLVVDAYGVVRNANPAAKTMLLGRNDPNAAQLLLSARNGWEGLAQLVNESFDSNQALESEVRVDVDAFSSQRLFARTRLTRDPGRTQARLCVLFLEDLREVEARVRTDKLASMGRMSAAVAHEIRNPLSAITQANALLDEEVVEPTQKRLTRMIEQNAQRLARIVEDILNVARVQPQPSDQGPLSMALDAAVRRTVHEWARQNEVGNAVSVHPHTPSALVGFDPEHLRRLLVNLLDNALRHASNEPSSIRVITQPAGPERVRLSVWSDGEPLETSVARHLFEPFFSSESRSSGLGLYICRELCERYGAQIAYQRSRLDGREGNDFFVLMSAQLSDQMPADEKLAHPIGDSVPGNSLPGMPRPSTGPMSNL